ncbi:serine protease persephone-like isoform X3 [Anopheles funestus]|uniref:serine protease persephone-like n=1 Tax=Anopheles funestus TaxID=62324 RepID=UPI0007D13AC8|nr:serine protease persephone-like [Anopheles funestus]
MRVCISTIRNRFAIVEQKHWSNMVVVRVLVLMQMLYICNVFGVVKRPNKEIFPEGKSCRTPVLDSGKCMNVELCDPAFLYSLRYHDHTSACQRNAFHKVYCCQPFLDFCKTRKNTHITHGTEAEPGMFPHLARLGENKDGIVWRCSASIISVNFLLSAAHCVQTADIAGVGCTEPLICEQQITVKNFISHPEYKKPSKYHDIALVELNSNIKFNDHVLPICPYARMDDLPETEDLIIAGWGRDEDYKESQHLMYATVRTVPKNKCGEEYRKVNRILGNTLGDGIVDEQYCAQGALVEKVYSYVDACQGDSGGPLQVRQNDDEYLIGVISTGIGCGSSLPGLYTRVAAYFNWINTTITGSQSIQYP